MGQCPVGQVEFMYVCQHIQPTRVQPTHRRLQLVLITGPQVPTEIQAYNIHQQLAQYELFLMEDR